MTVSEGDKVALEAIWGRKLGEEKLENINVRSVITTLEQMIINAERSIKELNKIVEEREE